MTNKELEKLVKQQMEVINSLLDIIKQINTTRIIVNPTSTQTWTYPNYIGDPVIGPSVTTGGTPT